MVAACPENKEMKPNMQVRDVLETVIYVDDLKAAEHFYTAILGLQFVSRNEERFVFLKCGNRMFLIFNPDAKRDQTGLPPHGADGAQHVAFSVPISEMDQWRSHLEANGISIEKEVNWGTGKRSLYFRDPAGNSIELGSPVNWDLCEIQ